MALEDLLVQLNASIQKLTDVIEGDGKLRQTAIAVVTDAAKPPAEPAKKAAPKAEEKAPEPSTGEDRVSAEQAEVLKGKVAAYFGGADRANEAWSKAERDARRTKIRNLLQHDQIKVAGTSAEVFDTANVKASAFDLFVKNVDGLTKKGDITTEPAASGAASSDLEI